MTLATILRKQPLPRVPLGIELSYSRALRLYVRQLRADVLTALRQAGPDILAAARRTRSDDVNAPPEDFNEPSADGWSARLDALFATITDRVQDRLRFVPPIIRRTARATDAHSIGEWRRQIRAAFGVDITLGNPDLRDMLRMWEAENLNLITRMSADAVGDVRGVFVDGVVNGDSLRTLTARVRERLDVSEARATLIGRDQIGKLNGQLQRSRQTAAGIESYVWRTSGDERVRPTHRARNGRTYRWSDGGIKPGQEVRCFPGSTKFNLSNGCHKLWRRHYRGELTCIRTSGGGLLSATPNHPILTLRGWLAMDAIQEGDYIIKSALNGCGLHQRDPNELVASADDLFHALVIAGARQETWAGSVSDFHGDGIEGHIDVIDANGLLADDVVAALLQERSEFNLSRTNDPVGSSLFSKHGAANEMLATLFDTSNSVVGSRSESKSFFGLKSSHTEQAGLGSRSEHKSPFTDNASDCGALEVELSPQRQNAIAVGKQAAYLSDRQIGELVVGRLMFPGSGIDTPLAEQFAQIVRMAGENGPYLYQGLSLPYQALRVIQKSRRVFVGHVYNLETYTGWFLADDVVSHNCRCAAEPVFPATMQLTAGRAA